MIGYLLRRAWSAVHWGGTLCAAFRCPHRQVGFSIYCREHTDAVLASSFPECQERLTSLPESRQEALRRWAEALPQRIVFASAGPS